MRATTRTARKSIRGKLPAGVSRAPKPLRPRAPSSARPP
jgi:hypothetical protein